MFGYSPDFNRGAFAERAHGNLANLRAQHDNDRSVAAWQSYARQLEARLAALDNEFAQAVAETKAARVQRNVLNDKLSAMMDALRQSNPRHPLCNDAAVTAALRKETDEILAKDNIMVDRTRTPWAVVRIP